MYTSDIFNSKEVIAFLANFNILLLRIFSLFKRRWVLVDANDAFVSQLKDPKLVLVVPHFEDDKYLCLNAPGMETLKVDIELKAEKTEYKRIR